MVKKILTGVLYCVATVNAQAQPSAGFTINGTVSPPPCTIVLGDGGVIDFGTLQVSDMTSSDSWYQITVPKQISLAMNCPGPTRIALSLVDNQGAPARTLDATPQDMLFGMGTAHGQNIGHVTYGIAGVSGLKIKTTPAGMAQTPATTLITRGQADSSSIWANAPNKWLKNHLTKTHSITFSDMTNAAAPASLVQLSGNLDMVIRVDKSMVNHATSAINLNGSSTLTLTLL